MFWLIPNSYVMSHCYMGYGMIDPFWVAKRCQGVFSDPVMGVPPVIIQIRPMVTLGLQIPLCRNPPKCHRLPLSTSTSESSSFTRSTCKRYGSASAASDPSATPGESSRSSFPPLGFRRVWRSHDTQSQGQSMKFQAPFACSLLIYTQRYTYYPKHSQSLIEKDNPKVIFEYL